MTPVLALVAHTVLSWMCLVEFLASLHVGLWLLSLCLSSLCAREWFDPSQASRCLLEFGLYGHGLGLVFVYSADATSVNGLLVFVLVIMLVGPLYASPVDLFACT